MVMSGAKTLGALVLCAVLSHGAQDSLVSQPITFPSHNELPPRFAAENFRYAKANKAIHNAAVRLLKLSHEQNNVNWVVSPLSLAAVLGELMLGARGEFRKVLGDILSPGTQTKEQLGLDVHKELGNLVHFLDGDEWTHYLLFINGVLFIHPEIKLKCSYKHALADIYGVDVVRANFSSSPDKVNILINEWVKKATLGRIQTVLPHPLSPTTASLFVNTVYFKGQWKTPFDMKLTKPGIFQVNQTHQVLADFMLGDIEVTYAEHEECDCSMIGIPYEHSEVVLYIFLPNKKPSGSHFKLVDFATKMNFELMANVIESAEVENVSLILPKVKLSSTLSLRKPLVRAVNATLFSGDDFNSIRPPREVSTDAAFSQFLSNSYVQPPLPLRIGSKSDKVKLTFNMGSASDDYRFQIDDVIHKVELDINESGTEAVAVSTTLIDYFGVRLMRIDRPFMFLIRHEYTMTNLFWGTVFTPEAASKN